MTEKITLTCSICNRIEQIDEDDDNLYEWAPEFLDANGVYAGCACPQCTVLHLDVDEYGEFVLAQGENKKLFLDRPV